MEKERGGNQAVMPAKDQIFKAALFSNEVTKATLLRLIFDIKLWEVSIEVAHVCGTIQRLVNT